LAEQQHGDQLLGDRQDRASWSNADLYGTLPKGKHATAQAKSQPFHSGPPARADLDTPAQGRHAALSEKTGPSRARGPVNRSPAEAMTHTGQQLANYYPHVDGVHTDQVRVEPAAPEAAVVAPAQSARAQADRIALYGPDPEIPERNPQALGQLVKPPEATRPMESDRDVPTLEDAYGAIAAQFEHTRQIQLDGKYSRMLAELQDRFGALTSFTRELDSLPWANLDPSQQKAYYNKLSESLTAASNYLAPQSSARLVLTEQPVFHADNRNDPVSDAVLRAYGALFGAQPVPAEASAANAQDGGRDVMQTAIAEENTRDGQLARNPAQLIFEYHGENDPGVTVYLNRTDGPPPPERAPADETYWERKPTVPVGSKRNEGDPPPAITHDDFPATQDMPTALANQAKPLPERRSGFRSRIGRLMNWRKQ
jgi:hypothetical protein